MTMTSNTFSTTDKILSARRIENAMSTPLIPELQTEEGKILSEMVQLLNYICAAPTINRQDLATNLLGVAAKIMHTLHEQKLKIQLLEKQPTEVKKHLEDAKESEDSESCDEPCDSLSSEELNEIRTWIAAKHMDIFDEQKLKHQSLDKQQTGVNEQPENAQGSVQRHEDDSGDSESCIILSSEEIRTDSAAKHMDIFNNLKLNLEPLEKQQTDVNELPENAQGSVPHYEDDSEDFESYDESCDSVSSEKSNVAQLLTRLIVSGETIMSSTSEYKVKDILGSGSFGVVVQCLKKPSNETVALKIIKERRSIEAAKEELEILCSLKALGSEQFNIVSCVDSFIFSGYLCIEFKKLDISLINYIRTRGFLPLNEIRPVLQQLTEGLAFLKDAGVVHSDIKPDNIMLVDHVQQPLKVKLIDFGEAMRNPEQFFGATFQTLLYRSPEVLLGTPFGCAVDVWSLGCIAAEMLIGSPLFDINTKSELMQHIIFISGQPSNKMLEHGLMTDRYFEKRSSNLQTEDWVLKSQDPKSAQTSSTEPQDLHDLLTVPVAIPAEDIQAVECDRLCFVDLVQKMLHTDAAERITPEEILSHPFITLSHLNHEDHNSYVKSSIQHMEVCCNWSFDGGENPQQAICNTSNTSNSESNLLTMDHPLNCEEEHSVHEDFIREENSETNLLTMDHPLSSEEEPSVHENFTSSPEERHLEDLNGSEYVSRLPEQNEEETQCTTADGTSLKIENTSANSNATIQGLIAEVTQLKAVIEEKDKRIKELTRNEEPTPQVPHYHPVWE